MVKGMGKGPAHDVLQVLHLLRWSTHTHPATKKGRVWGGHPNTSKTRSTGNPKETQPPSPRKKDKGGGKPRGPQNHHGTASLSWTCVGWLKGSRPCNVQVRLVTAVSLTSNWCTSEPHQKPKGKKTTCKPTPHGLVFHCSMISLREARDRLVSTLTQITI